MRTRVPTMIGAVALLLFGLCVPARAAERGEATDPAWVAPVVGEIPAANGEADIPSSPPTSAASRPAAIPQVALPVPAPERQAPEIATVHRVRRVPLGLGLGVLGTSYGLKLFGSLLISTEAVDGGCLGCYQEAAELLVPIAGPLLVANKEDPHGHSPTGWAVASVWSAAEATAVILTIIGLVGEDVPVQSSRRPAVPVTVAPIVTRGLAALSLNVVW